MWLCTVCCLSRVDRQKCQKSLVLNRMCLGLILSMAALDSNNLIPTVLCAIKVFYRFFLAVHCSGQSIAPAPWVRHTMTIENSSGVVEIPQILIVRERPITIFLALVKSGSVEFSGVNQ